MNFDSFDARGYPTVSVRDGYGEWAETYETSVLDEMDIRLLKRVAGPWLAEAGMVADLACGTGRTGQWLRAAGVGSITGVDITPQMLAAAEAKSVYDRLVEADVTATGLDRSAFDLCTLSLADEHLPSLSPLYGEAARLLKPGGRFMIAGYHPHFLLMGLGTHFHRADGSAVGIRSYIHLFSDHVAAAHGCGFVLESFEEGLIDAEWIAAKPKWARYENRPVSYAVVWRLDAPSAGAPQKVQ